MESLFGFAVVIGLIGGVAFGIRRLLENRKGRRQPLDTKNVGGLQRIHFDQPYAKKKYFFSVAERSFYEVLRRLVPTYTVFAKVRLADLIYATKGTGAWRRRHGGLK
jgi:hypothetical protein